MMAGGADWLLWVMLAAGLWLAWVPAAHWLTRNPKGDVAGGLATLAVLAYARLVHRLRIEGREHLYPGRQRDAEGRPIAGAGGPARGLIVVANHGAGVDPVLIQAACPFFIRWMMASEMRLPVLGAVWTWMEIIFVGEDGQRRGASELGAIRDAVSYIKAGGVVGIFPEGRLERPSGVLHPFQPGAGLIVARSGGLVLPIVVTGTPACDTAWASLARRSRAVVRVMPPIDYTGVKAGGIVPDLQARFAGWTGWPVVAPAAGGASSGGSGGVGGVGGV